MGDMSVACLLDGKHPPGQDSDELPIMERMPLESTTTL
jgi:hypothetical protein